MPETPTARRRYRRQLREAALRSTASEAMALEALEQAVRGRQMPVPEASERLRAMLREQHNRTTTTGGHMAEQNPPQPQQPTQPAQDPNQAPQPAQPQQPAPNPQPPAQPQPTAPNQQ